MAIYKLIACGKDYIWGGRRLKRDYGKEYPGEVWAESWELSCHPDGEALIGTGRFAGATLTERISAERAAGRNPAGFASPGKNFPLLIKLIDTGSDLSVQVHPGDAYAMAHEGEPGKTEMWLVLDCEEGACLCYGFKNALTRAELSSAIEQGSLPGLLNIVPVKKGDVFLIEPGTVHAVGAGITLAEVQQSSNVAYRVFDYGRTTPGGTRRPLHIEKALDVMNLSPAAQNYNFGEHLCRCPFFTVDDLQVAGHTAGYANGASFHHLLVLGGSGTLTCGGEVLPFIKGDSLFVEAGSGTYTIEGCCRILKTYIEPAEKGKKHRIGVDIGGTNVYVGVINTENEILATASRKTGAARPVADVVGDITDAVKEVFAATGLTAADFAGIGVGCPGLVERTAGLVVYTPNLGWEGVPLASMLEESLHLPVYLGNDASCAALGEVCAGAAKGCKNAAMITLGTGVGSGFVIDGKLFDGGAPGGAEFGHTTLVAGGEQCSCGRKGCYEAYASATALVRQAKRAAEAHPESLLCTFGGPGGQNLEAPHIFKAAAQQDTAAAAVLSAYVQYLADGIVNIINVFRPQKILLSGGLSGAGAALTVPLNRLIAAGAYAGSHAVIPVVEVAQLGNDAGIIGAANLV